MGEVDGSAPMPAQFALYVGDLDVSVKEEDLFEVFNKAGKVSTVRLNLSKSPYAYVNYTSQEDACRALESLNFTPLRNKPMRIMFVQPNHQSVLRERSKGNLYIKFIPKAILHKDLYEAFAPFGKILTCKVEVDSAGVSKGFGYVQYEDEKSAKDAIEKMNGEKLSTDADVGLHVDYYKKPQERKAETTFNNVFVKNLPHWVDKEHLKKRFESYGVITSTVVMKDANGESKGFGFVCYEKHEDAAAAIDGLNGKAFEESQCCAKLAEPSNSNGEKAFEESFKPMYVGKAMKKAERTSELQQANLYIKNLEDDVDDAKLKEMFEEFGIIVSSKVMRDSTKGYSKGFGFVSFQSPEQANRARCCMHNKIVGKKLLYVGFAQTLEERKRFITQQAQNAECRVTSSQASLSPKQPMFQQPIYFGDVGPTYIPQAYIPQFQYVYPPQFQHTPFVFPQQVTFK